MIALCRTAIFGRDHFEFTDWRLQLVLVIHIINLRCVVLTRTVTASTLWRIADLIRAIGGISDIVSWLEGTRLKAPNDLERIPSPREDIVGLAPNEY